MKMKLNWLLALLLAAAVALSPIASAHPVSAAQAAPEAEYAVRTAEAYNENDYQKLAAFLEQDGGSGVKNGQRLSASYDALDPETWGADASGAPRFRWVEANGEMRLQSVSCANIPGSLRGTLDLSGCTALESLVINTNSLTALNVSDCPALYLLNCAQNSIAALDISGSSAIRFLECRWNQIPNLDVSHCPELSVLICTDNRLKTLDLRSNPLITGVKYLRMVDGGNKFISCYIAQDPEYNNENLFFISADCADGCTTYNGWYTEDGRFITDYTVFTPGEGIGTSFVARFTLYGSAPGDADGSGSVDLADALRIMRISTSLSPMQNGAGADVNGDGTVNMIDAMLVMRRSMAIY